MCALLMLVVLTSQLRSTSALLAKRPPECVGGCVSEDTSDLRSLCPVNVLANVMTRDEADALVQEAEAYAAVHGWTKTRHHRYERGKGQTPVQKGANTRRAPDGRLPPPNGRNGSLTPPNGWYDSLFWS